MSARLSNVSSCLLASASRCTSLALRFEARSLQFLSLRQIHSTVASCNTVNQRSNVRTEGPERTEQRMHKRMQDKRNEAEAAETPAAFANSESFLHAVNVMYMTLHKGLADMLESNEQMTYELHKDHHLEISLGPEKGSFMFNPEVDTQRLIVFSPVSAAAYRYRYDLPNSRWIADSDNHILEELFVREILRSDLKGFPQL